MFAVTPELAIDVPAREALLDRAFGSRRRAKTSERLREGRLPAEGLAFSARDKNGQFVGTVRLWDVAADSGGPALLLGPLAVDGGHRRHGIGQALMSHAIAEAKRLGHGAILLVGDEAYYGRFGFAAERAAGLYLPGPFERERLLGLDLKDGALDGAAGLVSAAGRLCMEEAEPAHASISEAAIRRRV